MEEIEDDIFMDDEDFVDDQVVLPPPEGLVMCGVDTPHCIKKYTLSRELVGYESHTY